MSSKQYDTATREKSSATPSPHPDGVETSAFKFCPHCGGELGDEGLALHMSRGRCDEHTSPNNQAPPAPEPTTISPPLLEEHDEREHVDDDIEQRRALADELEAEGVWVDHD